MIPSTINLVLLLFAKSNKKIKGDFSPRVGITEVTDSFSSKD